MNRYRAFQIIGLVIIFSMTLSASGVGVAQETIASTQTVSLPELSSGGTVSFSNDAQQNDELLTKMAPTDEYTVTLGLWRNLRPTESYLHDVSMLPSSYEIDCSSPDQKSKGWIVGSGGVILSYCNGVWDHAITVESIPTTLRSVQALSPILGVAVGEDGAILLYLYDNIALDYVWTKSPIPVGNHYLYGVSMVPDGSGGYTGWAVGQSDENGRGTLVRGSITPGAVISGNQTYNYTWENLTAAFPSLPQVDYYFDLQMLSPTNGWAVGGKDGEYGTILHWDGTSWSVDQEIGTRVLLGIHMRSSTDGWAVGKGGVIYHYNGSNWSQVNSPVTGSLVDVKFDSNGVGWAGGYNGTLAKYSGGSWSAFTDLRTDPIDFRAIDFTSGHGWMVGFNNENLMGGDILEYEDNLWLAVTPPTANRLNDIAVISDSDAWAVGNADNFGGTIIHWDGRHWQRLYQRDLPIPAVDLHSIDMVSSTNGWAAGDPPETDAPAVFLEWNGFRWKPPRYDAPVNVRVNDIAMLNSDFGWAVADGGNAVAKYDGNSGFWSANHTCQGYYYQLFGTSVIPDNNILGWDAWAVGIYEDNPEIPEGDHGSYFLRYQSGCSTGYAWQTVATPRACDPVPDPEDGFGNTTPYDIAIQPGPWGYAVGSYKDRASIYMVDPNSNFWIPYYCMHHESGKRPSRFYSVDIIDESGVTWIGGYYYDDWLDKKVAYINYIDVTGRHFVDDRYLLPDQYSARNCYHRPIRSISMSSETMGWAVGDSESSYSVIYQYPHPNFTISISPDVQVVKPGGSTTFSASTYSLGGTFADVTLSTSYVPSGMTVDILPDTIGEGVDATITTQTTPSISVSEYDIPIWGYAVFRSGDLDIPVWRMSYLHVIVTDTPVYSVSPSKGPSGTTVTISGENFGSDPGIGERSSGSHHVILAGEQLPDSNVLSWSNNSITVHVPNSVNLYPLGPTIGAVKVVANNAHSNDNLTFQLENRITDISSVEDPGTGETTVTLTGTSFGNDPGYILRSTDLEHVSLGESWIQNFDVLGWSNNQITFKIPSSTSSGYVSVTSNGYRSNEIYLSLGSGSEGKNIYLPLVVR